MYFFTVAGERLLAIQQSSNTMMSSGNDIKKHITHQGANLKHHLSLSVIMIIPPFLISPFDRVQTTLFEDLIFSRHRNGWK